MGLSQESVRTTVSLNIRIRLNVTLEKELIGLHFGGPYNMNLHKIEVIMDVNSRLGLWCSSYDSPNGSQIIKSTLKVAGTLSITLLRR